MNRLWIRGGAGLLAVGLALGSIPSAHALKVQQSKETAGLEELEHLLTDWPRRLLPKRNPALAAGLEEEDPPEAELTPVRNFELANVTLHLARHQDRWYLTAAEPVFIVENQLKRVQPLPLREEGFLYLGRATDSDVRINHQGISRRHAALLLNSGGSVEILDLGSRYGTRVDGKALQPTPSFLLSNKHRFFMFRQGLRYFIAGLDLVDPQRPGLRPRFVEVPFGSNDSAILGRNPDESDVVIDAEEISRSHAILSLNKQDGTVRIQDGNSLNGTFLGGKKLSISEWADLYDPLLDARVRVELAGGHPSFSEILRQVDRVIFLDPDKQREAIKGAVLEMDTLLGAAASAELPFELSMAIALADAGETTDHYLDPWMERFLYRVRSFGEGRTLSHSTAMIFFYFLFMDSGRLGPVTRKLQYESALAFRDLDFPRNAVPFHLMNDLITNGAARDYYDGILVDALGKFGRVPDLLALVKRDDLSDSLRARVVKALGEAGSSAADPESLFKVLERLTYADSKRVVLAVMEALRALRRPAAAFLLVPYAFPSRGEFPDPEIQAKAAEVFHELVQQVIEEQVARTDDTRILPPLQMPPPDSTSAEAGLEEAAADRAFLISA